MPELDVDQLTRLRLIFPKREQPPSLLPVRGAVRVDRDFEVGDFTATGFT